MRKLASCGMLLALMFPCLTARADILDQSFSAAGGLLAEINEGFFAIAQSFTAGITGDLLRIQVDVVSQPIQGSIGSISPYPIDVSILAVANDLPTIVLTSVTLPPDNYLLGTSIFLPQPIPVVAGDQYAISVNYVGAPPIGPGSGQGHWIGGIGDPYHGGKMFFTLDGHSWTCDGLVGTGKCDFDLAFRTFVEPTASAPEPGALLMAVFGVAAITLRPRRRNSAGEQAAHS